MYLNQVSQQAHAQQQQQLDPYAVAQLQQQQQQVLQAQQAALYSNNSSSNLDALDIPQQSQMGHQQSASISGMNGFQNGTSGAPTVNGLLAPARGQHSRAVSLPVFAQQVNGQFQENGNSNGNGERRGHQYQSSFSGGNSNGNGVFGNGYGLAIQDGMGMNMNGLNGWAEEEVVGN
jgi:hypothetical protein